MLLHLKCISESTWSIRLHAVGGTPRDSGMAQVPPLGWMAELEGVCDQDTRKQGGCCPQMEQPEEWRLGGERGPFGAWPLDTGGAALPGPGPVAGGQWCDQEELRAEWSQSRSRSPGPQQHSGAGHGVSTEAPPDAGQSATVLGRQSSQQAGKPPLDSPLCF